jgi:hypothetical protein
MLIALLEMPFGHPDSLPGEQWEESISRKRRLSMPNRMSVLLVALALVVLAGSTALADDKDNAKNRHEGTVVSVTETKLIMKGKEDNAQHSHTVAANAKIMCDGKECKLEDLKPGQKIRVTTKKDDKTVAIKVEALDKEDQFPKDSEE